MKPRKLISKKILHCGCSVYSYAATPGLIPLVDEEILQCREHRVKDTVPSVHSQNVYEKLMQGTAPKEQIPSHFYRKSKANSKFISSFAIIGIGVLFSALSIMIIIISSLSFSGPETYHTPMFQPIQSQSRWNTQPANNFPFNNIPSIRAIDDTVPNHRYW